MSSLVSRTQNGARRGSLRLPNSLNGAYGDGGFEVLSEDGERVLCRGWRRGDDGDRRAVLVVLPAAEQPSPSSLDRFAHEFGLKIELDGAWAAQPLELDARRRSAHVGARGYRRRAARSVARRAHGDGTISSRGHRHCEGFGPRSCARTRPQGRQAGQHSGEQRDGGGAAHGIWHRFAALSSATGFRAFRCPQRHARLYGAGANRTDEPFDRLPQRSLRPRRNLIRNADGSFAVHRRGSHRMGALPPRQAAVGARRPCRTEFQTPSRRSF